MKVHVARIIPTGKGWIRAISSAMSEIPWDPIFECHVISYNENSARAINTEHKSSNQGLPTMSGTRVNLGQLSNITPSSNYPTPNDAIYKYTTKRIDPQNGETSIPQITPRVKGKITSNFFSNKIKTCDHFWIDCIVQKIRKKCTKWVL